MQWWRSWRRRHVRVSSKWILALTANQLWQRSVICWCGICVGLPHGPRWGNRRWEHVTIHHIRWIIEKLRLITRQVRTTKAGRSHRARRDIAIHEPCVDGRRSAESIRFRITDLSIFWFIFMRTMFFRHRVLIITFREEIRMSLNRASIIAGTTTRFVLGHGSVLCSTNFTYEHTIFKFIQMIRMNSPKSSFARLIARCFRQANKCLIDCQVVANRVLT